MGYPRGGPPRPGCEPESGGARRAKVSPCPPMTSSHLAPRLRSSSEPTASAEITERNESVLQDESGARDHRRGALQVVSRDRPAGSASLAESTGAALRRLGAVQALGAVARVP